MIDMLIASSDTLQLRRMFNKISNENSKNIRISKVTTNETETIEILNNANIDVALLDLSSLDGEKILNGIKENKKGIYVDSIIVMTKSFKDIKEIIGNRMIFDYIIKDSNDEEILFKINRIAEIKDIENKRDQIMQELKYIGYNIEYIGTKYLVETILELYRNRDLMLDNLQQDIYPILSTKHNKSVHNIKCNITWATDNMYCECDSDRLKKYFGFYDDIKPTAKIVALTVLSKIS